MFPETRGKRRASAKRTRPMALAAVAPAIAAFLFFSAAGASAITNDANFVAEGTVRPGFVEYIVIQNPHGVDANISIHFQASNDSGVQVTIPTLHRQVPQKSRGTINLNDWVLFQGVPTPVNVSFKVKANVSVAVERPMYFHADPALGHHVGGGSDVGAIYPAPSTTFYFPDGTVRPGFVEYLVVSNPGSTSAFTTFTFQAVNDGGQPVLVPIHNHVVHPGHRFTLNLNMYLASQNVPTPINISTVVTSDHPVVAERPVYFHHDPGMGRVASGGTSVIGATTTSTEHYFAEGTIRPGFQQFIALQNPTGLSTAVTLSFQAVNDAGIPILVPDMLVPNLAATSRQTININGWMAQNGVPTPVNFATKVKSTHPIVAERPIYFHANPGLGAHASGGTTAIGATAPATEMYFAEGTARNGFLQYITIQNANASAVDVTLSFQAANDVGQTISIADFVVTIPAKQRFTFNMRDYIASQALNPPLNISTKLTSTHPVVAERPMYFNADPALGRTVNGGTVVMGAA